MVEPDVRRSVGRLLKLVEDLLTEIAAHREDSQRLRDELARSNREAAKRAGGAAVGKHLAVIAPEP
jgi:hypothetical protein